MQLLRIAFISVTFFFGMQISFAAPSLTHESISGVKLGEYLYSVTSRIGFPDNSTKEIKDSSEGCYVRVHYFDNVGLQVEGCRVGRLSKVRSLRVVKDEKGRTSKGARVGMTLSEVKKLYPEAVQHGEHSLVIEDFQTGMVLRFIAQRRVVYEISFYQMM